MYKRKMKLSPIHISLIALAILVVIAVIVTLTVKKDEPKEPTTQSGIVYDDSAVEGGWETLSQEEIEQRLNDKVQAGMINISCNTAPYFKDGKSEGNVMLVNELNNLYIHRRWSSIAMTRAKRSTSPKPLRSAAKSSAQSSTWNCPRASTNVPPTFPT